MEDNEAVTLISPQIKTKSDLESYSPVKFKSAQKQDSAGLNPVACKKRLDRSRIRYRQYAHSTIGRIMNELDSISRTDMQRVINSKIDKDLQEINQEQSKQINKIQFIQDVRNEQDIDALGQQATS